MDWNEATSLPPSQLQAPTPTAPAAPDAQPVRRGRGGHNRVFTNPETEKKFFDALVLFHGDIKKAAVYAGVGHTTVYDERNRNPIFAEKLKRAAVLNEAHNLSIINGAKRGEGNKETGWKKDWRAAAWELERRDRKTYGKNPNAVTLEMALIFASRIAKEILEFVPENLKAAAEEKIAAGTSEFASLYAALDGSSETETESDD